MKTEPLSIPSAIFWAVGYLGVMLVYTGLDVAVWRKWFAGYSEWIGLAAAAICSAGFLWLLRRRWPVELWSNVTPAGLLLAAACAVEAFLLMDCCLDPLLERAFPKSDAAYQEALERLARSPAASLLRVCLLAPVVEEILMRGFVLDGLRGSCGAAAALLVSSLMFAVLHFNMVQTLSALVCGLGLGLLYLKTGSVFCCILAHGGYNLLSWLAEILPRRNL